MDTFKTCGACGCSYTADKWRALPLKGIIDDRREHADGERLELRNCTCGSTLAVVTARALVYTGPLAALSDWLLARVPAAVTDPDPGDVPACGEQPSTVVP